VTGPSTRQPEGQRPRQPSSQGRPKAELSVPAKAGEGVPLRNDTGEATCEGPGCTQALERAGTGRPARFCSPACRVRSHRAAQRARAEPVSVEVDFGSASSRGRPPERAWMVRLRSGQHSVIVTIGLTRTAADTLASQIADLLGGGHL
jgi:hypothetical protein